MVAFFIFSLAPVCVASINVSVRWWLLVKTQFLVVDVLNLSSLEQKWLFSLFLKRALSFILLKKSWNCLFSSFLSIVFCVVTKIRFYLTFKGIVTKSLFTRINYLTCYSPSQNIGDFFCLSTVSIHHMQYGARLLSPEF